ncbi:type IV pilus twitching motility protein PilT [Cupriavidus sp. TMH.W2]|uniref:type IV pilus twitching motility protein PilT n=1 Tax=Cupriavidus sp. TMH.W2 TaxID=3434465 RepID=UPI003D7857C1
MSNPTLPFPLSVNFTRDEFYEFLRAATSVASDILIQSGDYGWVEVYGKQLKATTRMLEGTEVERALGFLYDGSGVSQLADGKPIDDEVEIQAIPGNFDRVLRYRLNATGARVGRIARGISITMRVVPEAPPPYDDLKLPQDITDNLFPRYGLVLIVGTTGSGKSTLLASANRRRLEAADAPVKIITYEDPVEFTLGFGYGQTPQPSQVQIGRNLTSFGDAGRNAMRRKADVVVMGESRDRESINACFEMALTGHAVYSTVHVDTPAEVFARMVSFFSEEAQPAAANKLLDTLKLVIAQKLPRTTDGKRVAVRSWLTIDREVKRALEEEPFERWGGITRGFLEQRRTSFDYQALPLVADGILDFQAFRDVTNMTIREAAAFLEEHGQANRVPANRQQLLEAA